MCRVVFSPSLQAGAFPFTLRCLEDEKRARMGVQEAVQHGESPSFATEALGWTLMSNDSSLGLLTPYEVVYTPANTVVAEFFFTSALLIFWCYGLEHF